MGPGALTPCSSRSSPWGLLPGGVPEGLREREGALAELSWPWPSLCDVVFGRGEWGQLGIAWSEHWTSAQGAGGGSRCRERMGFRKDGI